jgi:hypothetical protein
VDQLIHRLARGAAAAIVLLSLSACVSGAPHGGSTGSGGPAPATPVTGSASPTVSSTPTTLQSSYPATEQLIGELSSQRGINQLGPFPVTSDRVSVYIRCVGDGKVDVEIVGVASFANDCSPDDTDLGTQNTIDVRYVDSIVLRVSGDNTLLWAAALTVAQG